MQFLESWKMDVKAGSLEQSEKTEIAYISAGNYYLLIITDYL
ncbi:hypothetical protein [Chryseobacterium luquanense]|uniref:Uncharacterized protein n=1 Tax=Chryseobacterium luquanense TaxID=2983766 RepID=A0ABT3Y3K8_9FLAO|nr:hypothetical protein [Chryseobacterium luquanense]MCX8532720.1 hypothetical protein [Chryseobacterium luquanense]